LVQALPRREASRSKLMGQGESSVPVKRFVNNPRSAVNDTLEGLLWTNQNLCLLGNDADIHIVARSDWKRDHVAVIAGGGAGHEPSDVGFVGEGLLTAAVCGEIFTPPSPDSVFRALVAVTGSAGCLVVIRNHFSTVLAFRDGIRDAERHSTWPVGAKVRMVCVSDDTATSQLEGGRVDFKPARGVAGIVLVMKVAGAAAQAGLSLDAIYEEAQAMADVVRTQGVCFTSCSIPGQPNLRPIPPDEMEIGCGVHGELGRRTRVKARTTAREIIGIMVLQLMHLVPAKADLCVLLNNLGAVPPNEMSILAAEVMRSELGSRIKLFIGPAPFLTSLDTNGISLSIAPLDDVRSQRLCAPTICRQWLAPVAPTPPTRRGIGVSLKRMTSACFEPSENEDVSRMLTRVCEALTDAEQDLNQLDAEYKNGDCGRNLAHAARLLLSALPSWPLDTPRNFCICLAGLLRSVEGALSALFSIFFLKAGNMLSEQAQWNKGIAGAFLHALEEVQSVGQFAEGMRTFADALGPALRAAWDGWEAMAEAALQGARATAFMHKAVGRAAFTSPQDRTGVPDTGAMAVAFVFEVLAAPPAGRFQQIHDDSALADNYVLGDVIGTGAFGTVCRAVERARGTAVAIKTSGRRKEFGPRSFEGLDFLERQRMANWLFMVKPHIVGIFEVVVSPTSVHLVMENLAGLELCEWLSKTPSITERQAARLVRQMLQAVCEIHRYGMVHRDLKLENFVFVDHQAVELKLVDVVGTMSLLGPQKSQKNSSRKTLCGTAPYMSPEALVGECSPAVDVWAVGVAMYLVLSRDYPFPADSLRELHEAQQLPLNLDKEPWPHASEEARTFVARLLATDAALRPTAQEALQLEWLTGSEHVPDSTALLPAQTELPEMPRTLHMATAATMRSRPSLGSIRVKTLYLIRHGEALHNIEERRAKSKAKVEAEQRGVEGSSEEAQAEAERARKQVLEDEALRDAPLSLDGKIMALNAQNEINRLLNRGFPKPTGIVVSPLERTLQTAALIFPGNPNTHVVEALRERRTGLPCDERKRAEEVARRQTFCHMSFEHLVQEEVSVRKILSHSESSLSNGPEGKLELRHRTRHFLESLRDMDDDVIAVVTHKGFLRELERGPLGRSTASEFGNCEVRIYDVALPLEGGELVGHLRYCRDDGPE